MKPISVNHIVKSYRSGKEKVAAVSDISFDAERGELFGIIGPDGSGKTSLFRIIATLLLPDSGTVSVDGLDTIKHYKQIRKRLGYMPGKFSLYQDLTIEENIQFFATIFNTSVSENYELIKDIYTQIEPFKKRKAGKLSGGMKQKLALCCALIHRPSVLLLDEPTTGVDAVSRKEFWDMLKSIQNQGITILVSTPYMDEAGLCDRIALMQAGKVMSLNTPQNITAGFGRSLVAAKAADMLQLLSLLKRFPYVTDAYPFGEYHHVVLQNGYSLGDLVRDTESSGHAVQLIAAQPNIEDCFMALMKN
jgi:ABC-type multidrug transport system ATPase subunit